MKRNSLSTKLLALLLCVMMVIGCLPFSAFAANDWESEFDEADPIPGSSAETPYEVSFEMNENYTEGTAIVEVPENTTYYFATRDPINGMVLTANGVAVDVIYGMMRNPSTWTITNDADVAVEYLLKINLPEGTIDNPMDLMEGENTVTLEAGNMGYFYDFVAYADGWVTFSITGFNGWQWQIDNTTAGTYGNLYTSEDAEYVWEQTFQYTSGDEYFMMVNTFNPEDSWNAPAGDITVTVSFVVGLGTQESPIMLQDQDNYINIPAGETRYYEGYFSGMNMIVSGNEGFVVTYNGEEYADFWGAIDPITVESSNPRMPVQFSITNNSGDSASYYVGFAYPEGTMYNPQDLWDGSNEHTFAEGDGAWYFDYLGYSDGTLTITVSADCGWLYKIDNMTSYVYDDYHSSSDSPVVATQSFKYIAGDEYVMEIVTFDPDSWNTPAGTVNVEVTFVSGFGTEEAPYSLNDLVNVVTVADGDPVYYTGRFAGMNMTVAGTGDFSVILDGQSYAAVNGVVVIENLPGNNWMPPVFAIDGSGEFTVSFAFPAGHSENPAVAVLGDNNATVAEGTQGYNWIYIAEQDGELLITVNAEGGWTYTVNNISAWAYGDTQWSDSDPVINPWSVQVSAGDEIQIIANTYDPSLMPWDPAPAGEISVNLAYAPSGPAVDENLIFASKALSFQDYIGINYIIKPASLGYDSYYVETVQITPDGEVVEILEGAASGSNIVFVKQVLSWSMTENVTATLYGVKDGVVYKGETFSKSVEEAALGMIANYSQTAKYHIYCTVLVDMLNYGAEVQNAFGYNTTSLPNANLGEYVSFATVETPALSGTNTSTPAGAVTIRATSISMQSKVEIQFVFKKSDLKANYELRSTVNGETTSYPVDLTGTSSNVVIRVPVKAADMRAAHDIALYNADTDEVISAVHTITIEAFALSQVNNATAYKNLVIAMMKYGDAVAAL